MLGCLIWLNGCSTNSTDPDENNDTKFWAHPGTDAIELSFDLENSLDIDSITAGRIQYALDRARKIDNNLVDFRIKHPVSLHEIQLYCERRLYERFDERSRTFGIPALDNLINQHPPSLGVKEDNPPRIRLYYEEAFNTPLMANRLNIHSDIVQTIPPFPLNQVESEYTDIYIEKEVVDAGDVFIFYFVKITIWPEISEQYWIVRVFEDAVEFAGAG